MRNFVLVVFGDEKQGLRGLSALERLDREGSISVHGAALVERDEHGLLLVRKDTGKLLDGGLGAIVARAPGDLLEFVTRDLAPKTFALIAELRREWSSVIATSMETLGGRIACQSRASSGEDEPRSW